MSITVKPSSAGHRDVSQPYIKNAANQWVPLSEVWYRLNDRMVKIWPDQIVYIHTGYGYNLNMFNLFGSPTRRGKFIFINRGFIGGAVNGGPDNYALDTGAFPAGSDLTFINEGYVSGNGGDGASFTSSGPPGNPRFATVGGNGLMLRYPVFIDNRTGVIQGGGGGGGAVGDFSGSSRHNRGGGGGAGIPGGRARLDSWGGNEAQPGTMTAGGFGYSGATGGAPGGKGGWPSNRVNDDFDIRVEGAPGGLSIRHTGYIRAGSLGLDTGRVIGRQIDGLVGAPFMQFSHYGRSSFGVIGNANDYGNFGSPLIINLLLQNATQTTGVLSLNPSANAMTKVSQTRYSANSTRASSSYVRSPQTFSPVNLRFTEPVSGQVIDMQVRLGAAPKKYEPRSCFIAGSMVTMWDGSLKPIEQVAVGDRVKTAVGVSVVTDIDLPPLGDRPLYAFMDDKCVTSGEHSLWSRDPNTKDQWWSTRDMVQWQLEADTGFGPDFERKPFDLTDMEGKVWEFATETGWIATQWKRVDASPETQLYHLLLEEGGSYYVDGYLVSSMADSGGVDWETFSC